MAEPSSDDLKALSRMRLKDAVLLNDAKQTSGAYYLAGYAIECALKAIIAQSFRQGVIPPLKFVQRLYTHNLGELVALAGLVEKLKVRENASADFKAHWAVVSGWNEGSRYEITDPFLAAAMLVAVGDPKEGILEWLMTHW